MFFKKKKEKESEKKNDIPVTPAPDPPQERHLITKEFRVMGTIYHTDTFKKLQTANPHWKIKSIEAGKVSTFYKYNYINRPVKLIEEPDNEHDPNAVQVLVAGELVGYVPADEALEIKDILHNHEIKYISSFIGGGPYRIISGNEILEEDEKSISVTVKIGYVG